MTPEDETRLAEIRARWLFQSRSEALDVMFVVRLFDEEKRAHKAAESVAHDLLARLGEANVALAESERARTEAEATIQRMRDVFAREHDVRIAAENALAEERAKREAAEAKAKEAERGWNTCAREARALQGQEARADDAEAALTEERAKQSSFEYPAQLTAEDSQCPYDNACPVHEPRYRAQNALVEERAKREAAEGHAKAIAAAADRMRSHEKTQDVLLKAVNARAATAEARVRELESAIEDQRDLSRERRERE